MRALLAGKVQSRVRWAIWERQPTSQPASPAVLFDAEGVLRRDAVAALLLQRNNRPVTLRE